MGERVIVGMSGGLDSSVAAALLVRQGYDVVGVTIKTYRYEDVGGAVDNDTSCCSLDGINDARRVATALGIPHYVYDFTDRFSRDVINPFVEGYLAGETPNPCVLCNRSIKWEELLRRGEALGAGIVATGHYARLRQESDSGRWVLSRGRDSSKDQSYALWNVTQDSLSRTIFPLAELTKEETRRLAVELDLPIAVKPESYEICFIPDNDYGRFLRDRVEGLEERVDGGEIVRDGEVIGRHRGYPFYTVGQRRGLGLSSADPLYVLEVDPNANRVVVGEAADLLEQGLLARDVNMIKYDSLPEERLLDVRIRYKDGGAPARCRTLSDGQLEIRFAEQRRAITKGQSVVMYEGEDVVGGGIIDSLIADQPPTA